MNPRIRTGHAATWLLLALLAAAPAFAQGERAQSGVHTWPDDLEMITVTGTVIIRDQAPSPNYFLDIDGDETAEYHLSFGPWWYEPAGGATRPDEWATVTVYGALQEPTLDQLPTILVFELDGLPWRVAVEYGRFGWNGESFWDDTGALVTVTGGVMLDDTYYYAHYYLDEDGDGAADYKLGLGPYWYEPASGATRPGDGQTVTVVGRLHEQDGLDLLTVYELDGLVWRPADAPAPWAGRWVDRDATLTATVYGANNTDHTIAFPAGSMIVLDGGGAWPDSVFVQFWEIHPDSLPGPFRERRFIGFYMGVRDPQGNGLMPGPFGQEMGRLRFENELQFRFRYYEDDLTQAGVDEEDLAVEVWDDDAEAWTEPDGTVSIDTEADVVTLTSATLSSHVGLVGITGTAVEPGREMPSGVVLHPNYPNPFNPVTTIPYALDTPQHVTLTVYDVLGRVVATLVDEVQAAGPHRVVFAAEGLPSGVYVCRLTGARDTRVRPLLLLK